MQKEIDAALKAAKAYKVVNEGDRPHAELIVSMLTDCSNRVGLLAGFAAETDKATKVREAEDALRAAQSA